MIHRDDIDADQMQAIEQVFGELYPGVKIVCVGDVPPSELPPGAAEAIEHINTKMLESMANGTCFDCGRQMEGYEDTENDEWEPPAGWSVCPILGGQEHEFVWIC